MLQAFLSSLTEEYGDLKHPYKWLAGWAVGMTVPAVLSQYNKWQFGDYSKA
jgi:hypothetical protein